MQLRFVSVISITFLLSWIVGLILCWRSIFHSRGDETVYNPTRRVPGRELSRRVPYNRAHNQTRERKRRRRKKKPSHVEEKLPLPIFNVGFPKAGTSSVFSFFQRQGFRSQHWYCCKQQIDPQMGGPFTMADCMLRNLKKNVTLQNRSLFHNCGNFEVFSEINGPRCDGKKGCLLDDGTYDVDGPGERIFLPQHFNLPQLHDAFPNSTWILNTREVDSWTTSVSKWSDLQYQFANEFYSQNSIETLPSNQTEMNAFLKHIFLEHNEKIRDFVKNHPSHTLIEVNISDDNAGKVLAEAFGLDASFWSQRNKSFGDFYFSLTLNNRFVGSTWWWALVTVTTMYLFNILGIRLYL